MWEDRVIAIAAEYGIPKENIMVLDKDDEVKPNRKDLRGFSGHNYTVYWDDEGLVGLDIRHNVAIPKIRQHLEFFCRQHSKQNLQLSEWSELAK